MKASNMFFQTLVEHAPAGVFHCDEEGLITYVNPSWLLLLDLDESQAHGDVWFNVIAPDAFKAFQPLWLECMDAQIGSHHEVPLNPQDDNPRHVRIDVNPIIDANDSCIGYVGHVKDITSRVAIEKQQASNELSLALIEQSRIPCAIREENDRISYINPAFSQVFGYTLDDIGTTKQWYEKAYPNPKYRLKVERYWQYYMQHLHQQHNIVTPEAHITCKDGSIKTVLVSPSKLLGTSEDQYSISFYDISELKLTQVALEKSQERFALAVKGSGVGIWDWNIETGHVFFAAELKQELGYTDDELTNTVSSFYKYLHPMDKLKVKNAFNDHLSDKNTPYFTKYRMRHKNGDYHWYQGVGQSLKDENGHAYRMAGSHTNITQQMINHERLTLAQMVFDNSGEAIITTDVDAVIQATNPAFSNITGFDQDEIIGENITRLRSKKNPVNIVSDIRKNLHDHDTWAGEIWCNKKDNNAIAISIMITVIKNDKGLPQRYIALFTDVTEKKQNQELIWKQAHYDELTQLLNRTSFTKYINSAINSKHSFALLFIDLDHFKHVNDTLGHNVGDELLKQASHRIKHCVRTSDIVSRFGGDEFTVVLSGVLNESIIHRICSQIINSLSTPYDLYGEAAYISASIGVTQYPTDSQDIEELYKYADQAMYDAKRNGRNRYSFFTQELQIAANKHREIASDLRCALKNNEFIVLYQPIVNLIDNRVHKAEALLRWHHPVRGLVPPSEFIPIAEETGLIHKIGDWVFKQAAMQAKVLRKHYASDFQISINKSPIQFHSDYVNGHEQWSHFLATINLDGSAIAVEITEGLLLDSTAMVKEKLIDFQKSGMAISLDDFGTGYSALSYLKKFDIDFIKIDRSFVMNLENDSYDRILCETIISMAHKLGMKVIAEGIETAHQKQILIDAGCDYGQGYLFSKPITANQLRELIGERNN
jgi:diguanylate cyclase (GGDEF)-like protein/PAS domain S-box-containing protein